jgi:hypothetical protein
MACPIRRRRGHISRRDKTGLFLSNPTQLDPPASKTHASNGELTKLAAELPARLIAELQKKMKPALARSVTDHGGAKACASSRCLRPNDCVVASCKTQMQKGSGRKDKRRYPRPKEAIPSYEMREIGTCYF